MEETPEEHNAVDIRELKEKFRDQKNNRTVVLPDLPELDPDPMPEFVIKAQDLFALAAIEFYRKQCILHGLAGQGAEVEKALQEFVEWRLRNPDRVKVPDHKHVPVRGLE